MIRALYIFAGTDREELEKKVADKTAPDTSFFGFNHLKKDSRIKTDFLQLRKTTYKFTIFRRNQFLSTLYLLFVLGRKISSYDVVILTTSAYLNLLFLKKFGFFRNQRWIIFNIDMTIQSKKREGSLVANWVHISTLRMAHKILCLSNDQLEYLANRGLSRNNLVFLPLGIDKEYYKLLPLEGDLILAIGRDDGRDYETFLESASKLPNEKFIIICAKKNLQHLEDRIPSNVEVLYDLFNLEVRPYYEKAKCFVIPTKPSSLLIGSDCGGQTSVLDSIAYGRPVVITRHAWVYDYFEEHKQIITVPPMDADALRVAIGEISSDSTLRGKIIKDGRRMIDDKYNSLEMARRIGEIILKP